MSKEDLEIDDDFVAEDSEEVEEDHFNTHGESGKADACPKYLCIETEEGCTTQ